jgi:hypothetical protein
MYDTIYNNQFPSGAQAYAAYVDGGVGDQPNYAYIVSAFPKAEHLSISLDGSVNADALDVEQDAAVPGDVPGWYTRQKQRGIQRPCVYASVSTMQDSILPVLSQGKIGRSSVRLWTAHYDAGEHICGPDSCGQLSTEADGTQWTSSALGRVLDQSELQDNFFTTSTTEPTVTEAELQSGQLNTGSSAVTAISVPPGTAHHIAFGCDNTLVNQQAPVIRLAIYDTGWYTQKIQVNGTKGLSVIAFRNPAKTGVISILREDTGVVPVGYVIY